jgi:GTP-binding protein HflX
VWKSRTRAGAGETQIEVDRRLIRDKISKLKIQLSKIQKQRITQNKSRSNIYKIALVGYTNAGKSSLMNQLTNSNVLVKDKLFATLDTTTRKFELTSGLDVLISDTVGFIRNIPHNLIASFRSTLSEVNNVDMLLKVFDISSSNINDHIETVNNVLASLEVMNKKTIFILNKIDLIKNKEILNGLKIKFKDAIFISTKEKIGINILIESIVNIVSSDHISETIFVPYNKTKAINLIYQSCQVVKRIPMENSIHFDVKGNKENIEIIKKTISK